MPSSTATRIRATITHTSHSHFRPKGRTRLPHRGRGTSQTTHQPRLRRRQLTSGPHMPGSASDDKGSDPICKRERESNNNHDMSALRVLPRCCTCLKTAREIFRKVVTLDGMVPTCILAAWPGASLPPRPAQPVARPLAWMADARDSATPPTERSPASNRLLRHPSRQRTFQRGGTSGPTWFGALWTQRLTCPALGR